MRMIQSPTAINFSKTTNQESYGRKFLKCEERMFARQLPTVVFAACSAVIFGQSTSIRGMVVKQWTNLPPVKAGDQIISMNATERGVVVEVYNPSANSHTTVYY